MRRKPATEPRTMPTTEPGGMPSRLLYCVGMMTVVDCRFMSLVREDMACDIEDEARSNRAELEGGRGAIVGLTWALRRYADGYRGGRGYRSGYISLWMCARALG